MLLTTYKLYNGISLTLRLPSDADTSPVIILCHGFCGIQDILLPGYAEAFTSAGYATVTFDYRGFGKSEGERGRLIPHMQTDDICSVIDWVSTRPELNKARVALWGTSLGACHVFGAAVERPEVKCIISQMGFADGEAIVTGSMDKPEKDAFISALEKMVEKRERLGKEMFVPVTRVLGDEESRVFFAANRDKFPAMDIKIPFLTVYETLRYKPYLNAERVTCPTLIIVADEDTVNPAQQGIALYKSVNSPEKILHIEGGARHYDMYEGSHFESAFYQQYKFLEKYL